MSVDLKLNLKRIKIVYSNIEGTALFFLSFVFLMTG